MPQGQDIGTIQAKLPAYMNIAEQQAKQSMGKFDSLYINHANLTDFGNRGVSSIQALTAAVVDTLVGSTKGGKLQSGGETLSLPAGAILVGFYTSLKLASGTVIAYYANPADNVL